MKSFDAVSLDLVLDGWDALEPPAGFAERVMQKSAPRRWPLYACAAALLLFAVPLFATPHTSHPSPVIHVAGVPGIDDLDAGLRTD